MIDEVQRVPSLLSWLQGLVKTPKLYFLDTGLKWQQAAIYFWRDSACQEIDLLALRDGVLESYEIKSGATFSADWFKQLTKFEKLNPQAVRSTVIYGGDESSSRSQGNVLAWTDALDKL